MPLRLKTGRGTGKFDSGSPRLSGMGDKAVEILEGEPGVELKEKSPPKPARLRKADAQPSKKKKEGAPTSHKQGTKKATKEKAKPASNQHSSDDDENPLEWLTLNRCILLAVITILVSTGVNTLNETWGEFWGMEEVELTAEELALGGNDVTAGSEPEETESSLWNLFSWSWGSRYDCGADDNCDADDDDDVDYYYYYYAADDDDDGDDTVNDDDNNADDDDGDDAVDEDDDDDGDERPGGRSRKLALKREVQSESGREEHTVKRRKRLPREPEEDTTQRKRSTRHKPGDEEEEEEEE
ncbi:hypothetical protein ANANG_G00092030 [Anguilla anguilla]|uniref:Uncharacterized protein n=1 Tax=Anguilla anguilla TaxID=7936 RepID=A0A9D3MP11_ANGAN|nr:hypothetical protein ANANG_G00092030 [Anguilla anguilla]